MDETINTNAEEEAIAAATKILQQRGFPFGDPNAGPHLTTDEERKSLAVRIVMFAGRSVRRGLEFGQRTYKSFMIALFWFVALGMVAFLFSAFVQYLFTVNTILAWGVIGAGAAQISMTAIAWLARVFVDRRWTANHSTVVAA